MFAKRPKKLTPAEEQAWRDRMADESLDWRDRLAMLAAAFVTILLPCAVVLTLISGLMLWLFGGL